MTYSTPVHPGVSIFRLRLSGRQTACFLPWLSQGAHSNSELSALTILTITANFSPKKRPNQHHLFKKESG